MSYLLDTNAILWWLTDDQRLGPDARRLIEGSDAYVRVSIASLWEVSIKHGVGKLSATAAMVAGKLAEAQIEIVAIRLPHLAALEILPQHHRDPFDRLILAQALVEGAEIITSDPVIPRYGVPCIDATL